MSLCEPGEGNANPQPLEGRRGWQECPARKTQNLSFCWSPARASSNWSSFQLGFVSKSKGKRLGVGSLSLTRREAAQPGPPDTWRLQSEKGKGLSRVRSIGQLSEPRKWVRNADSFRGFQMLNMWEGASLFLSLNKCLMTICYVPGGGTGDIRENTSDTSPASPAHNVMGAGNQVIA